MVMIVLALALCLAGCAQPLVGSWERLGTVDGSVVLSMTSDPTVTGQLYAGTSAGQVIRTRVDSRGTAPSGGIPSSATVSVLVADPAHGGLVYAGTSQGLYVSTDYGDSWHARGHGLPQDDPPEALALDSAVAGGSSLYAGTQQHGAYMSRDGGRTWASASAGLPRTANIYSLDYDAAEGTLFAALTAGDGVYALAGGSQAWVARGAGLPAQADAFVVLPVAGKTGEMLYAGTSVGLYASADHAATWHAVGFDKQRVLSLAADPTAPSTVYAGTDTTVYRSTDGATWTLVAPGINHQVPAITVLADAHGHPVVFVGADSILRYPAVPGNSDSLGSVLAVIIFFVLFGVIFYFSRRSLRQLRTIPPGGSVPPPELRLPETG
jgi:hypothetical protein